MRLVQEAKECRQYGWVCLKSAAVVRFVQMVRVVRIFRFVLIVRVMWIVFVVRVTQQKVRLTRKSGVLYL
jgi:hypothetical protein